MTRRSPPPIPVDDFLARGRLDPSGRHTLLIETRNGLFAGEFTQGGLERLKRTIEEFERQAIFADGGPELLHRRQFPIEVR